MRSRLGGRPRLPVEPADAIQAMKANGQFDDQIRAKAIKVSADLINERLNRPSR